MTFIKIINIDKNNERVYLKKFSERCKRLVHLWDSGLRYRFSVRVRDFWSLDTVFLLPRNKFTIYDDDDDDDDNVNVNLLRTRQQRNLSEKCKWNTET